MRVGPPGKCVAPLWHCRDMALDFTGKTAVILVHAELAAVRKILEMNVVAARS